MSIRTTTNFPRKIRTISFPLSTLSERKVRVSYKQLNSLPANTTEEKIFSLIGTTSRDAAYITLTEMYNNNASYINKQITGS